MKIFSEVTGSIAKIEPGEPLPSSAYVFMVGDQPTSTELMPTPLAPTITTSSILSGPVVSFHTSTIPVAAKRKLPKVAKNIKKKMSSILNSRGEVKVKVVDNPVDIMTGNLI